MSKDLLEFKTLGIMSFGNKNNDNKDPNWKIGAIVLALFILIPILILWLKK
jgi:hypothetical protein